MCVLTQLSYRQLLFASSSNEVFGTGNDPVNLKTNIEECSWGKATVTPGVGDSNEVATGVIEVTIDIPLDGSSRSAIRNAVTAKVQDKLGLTLPGPYDYVLYSLENCYGSECGWAAYAYINHWMSVYQNVYYRRPGVLMHEVSCAKLSIFKHLVTIGDTLLTTSSVYHSFSISLDRSQLWPSPFRRIGRCHLH